MLALSEDSCLIDQNKGNHKSGETGDWIIRTEHSSLEFFGSWVKLLAFALDLFYWLGLSISAAASAASQLFCGQTQSSWVIFACSLSAVCKHLLLGENAYPDQLSLLHVP